MPVGERIAYWAERFIGVPYDPDPLGEYVTMRAIVADERADCMYLTFRAAELGLTNTPSDAASAALGMRFATKGRLAEDGSVMNYDERFQYAEDMIDSGRWGREITGELGKTVDIEGSRGRDKVSIIPKSGIPGLVDGLMSGDIVFFIKQPEKRVVGEIVGHLGIIKREGRDIYLIHASGSKNKGGEVRKVLFGDYADKMPFLGIRVARFY